MIHAFRQLRALLFLIPALFIIPALAFAQAPDTITRAVQDTAAQVAVVSHSVLSLGVLLSIVVPVLNGKITQYLVDGLKKVQVFAESASWIKQVVGLVFASLLALAVAFLGVHVSGHDLGTLTAGDVGVLVNAGLAWLIARLSHTESKLPVVASSPTV